MDLHKVKINFGRLHCGGQSITSLSALTPPEPIIFWVKILKICFNWDHYVDICFSFHIIFSQALSTYNSLIVGSLVRSIWNTGGGRVCCHTCSTCCGCPHTTIAFVRWSTPFSCSPWASNSSPSCISSRKNFWTASASLRSGNLESPALSLASFCFFLRSRSLFLKLGSLRLLRSK